MRDPDATLRFDQTVVSRTLHRPIRGDNFLRSPLAHNWVNSGRMVPYEMLDVHQLLAPRLPFVTHPDEWCDAQLRHAAELTLGLQAEAVEHGYDLKDASAWNVLFAGSRPIFCDHSSLQVLRERKWWAAGQFGRHFLLPLLLARKCGLSAHQSFAMWRDGVPPAAAAKMLGGARFLTRYWPLTVTPSDLRAEQPHLPDATASAADLDDIRRFRSGLHTTLQWMLKGLGAGTAADASTWSAYVDQRAHYAGDSITRKRQQLANWLVATRPQWTADLGCNSGEYSELALAHGSSVVALDGDQASLQALYLRNTGAARLYPVVAQLDDLSAGRGWAGVEHRGLAARMEKNFNLLMMLALLHHLAIGFSLPLPEIARFAARLTRRWLIVEFIGREDPQLRLLCAQRHRHIEEFAPELQRQAFSDAGFVVEATLDLAPTPRALALLRLKC